MMLFLLLVLTAIEVGFTSIIENDVAVETYSCTFSGWDNYGIRVDCSGEMVGVSKDVFDVDGWQTLTSLNCVKFESTIFHTINWQCNGN